MPNTKDGLYKAPLKLGHTSRVSCQKDPTHHAYEW